MKQNKPTNEQRLNSVNLHQGRAYMDIVDKQSSKKRKLK